MPDPFETALQALCAELELPVPTPDTRSRYELRVGELLLRLGRRGDREVVLEGPVLNLQSNAAEVWETQQDILRQALTWNLARPCGPSSLCSFLSEGKVVDSSCSRMDALM